MAEQTNLKTHRCTHTYLGHHVSSHMAAHTHTHTAHIHKAMAMKYELPAMQPQTFSKYLEQNLTL
jgi:hypothetical protein